jgi:hypothetical protein
VTFSHLSHLITPLAIRSDSVVNTLSIVSERVTVCDSHISDGTVLDHFLSVFGYPLQYDDISLSTRVVTIGNISIDGFCIFSSSRAWLHFLPIRSLILALYASTASLFDSDILGYLSRVIVSSIVSSSGLLPITVAMP